MLPCIVIDFFLNNQPDAATNQIYIVIKLHVSGILSAHHQEFSTVHSALVRFMQVLMTVSKQSGCNQTDAPFIQIYSVIKLHVSAIFSAHHQEFSTVHSALVNVMQVS